MKNERAMRKLFLYLVFSVLLVGNSLAQITINNLTALTKPQAANAFVDSLVGAGVSYSSPVLQGVRTAVYQAAYFTTATTTATQLGFTKGIVLSTGRTSDIPLALGSNPAASQTMLYNPGSCTAGEIRQTGTCATLINDLDILAGSVNYLNASILEFDFVPTGDSIRFRYIFGGEEYSDNTNFTNYQCSDYNDKFGFLISGPGIAGGAGYTNNARNIARLANNSEVGINSVNNGTVGSSGGAPAASKCLAANPAWVLNTACPEYNGPVDGIACNGNTDPLIAAQGGLTPGQTYHIKLIVLDANDATYDAVVFIEAGSFTSPQPTSSIHATPSSICSGNSTYVVVNTNYGTPPYTFSWSNGTIHTTNNPSDSILVSPTSSATYTVTVTDNTLPTPLNAVSSMAITVSNPIVAPVSQTNILCYGLSTGAASVSVSGGSGSITYSWSHNAGLNNASATNLPAGTYTVTATDGLSCPDTYTLTITQPAQALSATFPGASVTPVACFGNNTGSAAVTAAGGTTNYTYNWSHSGSLHTASASNLTAGNYTVTIIDANLCTATASVTVTQPAQALAASIPPASVTNVACYGLSTASATVTTTGGTTSYTYNWSHDASLHATTASGLNAGVYTVTVIDSKLCTATASVTVTQPAAAIQIATPVTNITNVNCYGNSTGAATLSVSGGTGAYTYSWSQNPGLNNASASSLSANTYTVTVTDANLCSSTVNLTITEPAAALSLTSSSTSSTCGNPDGSVTVAPVGGTSPYSFVWQNYADSLNATMTHLPAGGYTVTVTDNQTCTSQISISVSDMGGPVLSLQSATNNLCHGLDNGSIQVSATGGTGALTYAWTSGESTSLIQNLPGGIYTLTVTDQNNCQATLSYEVTEPDTLVAGLTPVSVSCYNQADGAIYLTAMGGTSAYTYEWSNASSGQNATGLTAGLYYVTVTDQNLCKFIDSMQVVQPDSMMASFVATDVTCFGNLNGSINLTMTGGNGDNSYGWSSGSINEDLSALSGAMYYLTVTDSKGCVLIDSAEVLEPEILAATWTVTNVTCAGMSNGQINLTVTGGNGSNNYLWLNHGTTEDITALDGGMYYFTVTDVKGCTQTDSVEVTEALQLTTALSHVNVTCFGLSNGSVDLTTSGGNGTNTYTWSNSAVTEDLTGLQAGSYLVTVTDVNGCSSTGTASVTQPAALVATLTSTDITCNRFNNGTINLPATGGTGTIVYAWSHDLSLNENQADSLTPGLYSITITDANNCTALYSATINEPEVLHASLNQQHLLCHANHSGSISLLASGGITPYGYIWSNGETTSDLANIDAGDYNVTVSDFNGCLYTDSVSVFEPEAISVADSILNSSCPGSADGSIILTVAGGVEPYLYDWSNGTTQTEVAELTNGNYSLTITDMNGCTLSGSYLVGSESVSCLNIPTAFSPNDDGANDTWEIQQIELYTEISIEIYNRWGQLMFSYSGTGPGYADVNNQWDGTYNGKELEISSFVYILDLKNDQDPIQGIVSIIK